MCVWFSVLVFNDCGVYWLVIILNIGVFCLMCLVYSCVVFMNVVLNVCVCVFVYLSVGDVEVSVLMMGCFSIRNLSIVVCRIIWNVCVLSVLVWVYGLW